MLNELIAEFRSNNRIYDSQRAALNKCYELSVQFELFAKGRGYSEPLTVIEFNKNTMDNPDPKAYAPGYKRNESGDLPCDWHCINDAGMVLIDWSVRQYTKATEFPHIMVKTEEGIRL